MLTEYKYDEEKKELVKSADPVKTTMIFTNYDRVAVSVSTGLFYGSTKLTGFGVKPAGEGFEVVRDDIEKSAPLTAAFLNFFDMSPKGWYIGIQYNF